MYDNQRVFIRMGVLTVKGNHFKLYLTGTRVDRASH